MEDRERIMAACLELAQKRGYGGFRLSDVAERSGVGTDRLNRQFKSKDELIAEIMRRYHTDFFAALATDSNDNDPPQREIERFIQIVRDVLVVDDRMCLCGMLAADMELLPGGVRLQASDFVAASIDWLEKRWRGLGHADPHSAAVNALARLEGGMLLARVSDDVGHFDAIAEDIRREFVALA